MDDAILIDKDDSSNNGSLMLSSEHVSRFIFLELLFNRFDNVFTVEFFVNIEGLAILCDALLCSCWDSDIELRDLYRKKY